MDARQRYFSLLETVIYEGNYCYLLFQKRHRARQWIEAGLAALSGGCLGAWILYNELAILYASVIVLTQIINSILPHFEIVKRDEALKYATVEFQPVLRQAEMGWHRIDSENLSDKDIEAMMQLLQLSVANVLDKLTPLGLKDDKEVCKAASERTDKYIETYLLNVA